MAKCEHLSPTDAGVRIRSSEYELKDRLRLAIGDEPGNAFARRAGVAESVLRKYLAGAQPSADRLVAMADAAGVSIEWLAAGRGPRKGAAGGVAVHLADLQRLTTAIGAVQQGLQASGRSFTPARYAELVVAAYQLLAAPGTTPEHIAAFIKAAA